MQLSGREAMRLLAPVVSGDAQAKVLLRSGLAGRGTETPRGPMYVADLVRALTDRPVVDSSRLPDLCPHGLYVSRLPRTTHVDLMQGWSATAAELDALPPMPALTAATLSVRVRAWSRLPWIATLCGFVVLGADVVGFRERTEPVPTSHFELRPPGAWFGALEGRRFPTRPGGRPWYLWTPTTS